MAEISAVPKDQNAPIYVRRNVTNAPQIIDWAKAQGLPKTVQPGDMHVTIVHSAEPVDLSKPKASPPALTAIGGDRRVKPLGDKGALVLHFADPAIEDRHEEFKEAGAKWDFPSFMPHVTLSYDASEVPYGGIIPYDGPIDFGPEIFEPLNDNFVDQVVEKRRQIIKVEQLDKALGLVFGWAIVCKVNGEDYYDLNVDENEDGSYERVPEHIPEPAMLKCALPFALGQRAGNDMHKGPDLGVYPFIFPWTAEIAKAMTGEEPKKTGLMVGFHPPAAIFEKYVSGDYTGFSIEGNRVRYEEHSHAAAA